MCIKVKNPKQAASVCELVRISLLFAAALVFVAGCNPPAEVSGSGSGSSSEKTEADQDGDGSSDQDGDGNKEEHKGHDDDGEKIAENEHKKDHDEDAEKEDHASPSSGDPVVMQLGDPTITQGIPGKGDLTVDEIKAWLDDPKNHAVIEPKLPLGLAAAAGNITGITENPMTLAKIELGRQLYFDTRLSKDNTVSCATCHHPDTAFGAHTQFGVGIDDQEGGRNSPVSYNRIVSGPQFWDGRADSLEAQAVGPIENPIEMGNTHENCVKTLAGIEGYKIQFEKIFTDGVNIDNVGKALATFERTLVTDAAPYDHWEIARNVEKQWGEDMDELEEEEPEQFEKYQLAKKEADKMTDSAKRGAELFFDEKSNCTACHAGANFADEKYHNLGVGMMAEKPDVGRFEITKKEIDKGAFKTPTLRNVALSGPFMHDGSQKTLEEVVEWYAKGGHPNPFLSEKMKKLELSDQDKADLVAFMREGLTSDFPTVATDRLPE